jgi:hypothetical protein
MSLSKQRLRARSLAPSFRPRLEWCEDRLLPATFIVTDLGDAGVGFGQQGDLRYAITTANSNADPSNRIVFQPGLQGTITLTQGELAVQKSLEIVGPGEALLTIDGAHRSGVFDVTDEPGARNVRLSGLTVTGGTGALDVLGEYSGGGLYARSATVTLTHITFEGNTAAGSGGAVDDDFGTMVLNHCTVADNRAGSGGGINNRGAMTVNDSLITGNSGGDTGGMRSGGTLTINRSTIASNTATSLGGGGIDDFTGILTVNDSTIIDNVGLSSGNNGGGIANEVGQVAVTDCTIAGNTANYGGGIDNVGSMTISDSTIAGNTGRASGGGIASHDSDLNIGNSTISGNTAQGGFGGGGIFLIGSFGFNGYDFPSLELTAVTITLNTATAQGSVGGVGGGIWVDQEHIGQRDVSARVFIRSTIVAGNASDVVGPDVFGPVISAGHSLVGATDNSRGWAATDLQGTQASPLDPRLGPLQDNGGPTFTHAILTGSPAVAAGDVALRLSNDQRGTSRSVALVPDIGAFEAAPAVQFRLIAPPQVGPGEPFSLSVIALDAENHTASTYTGTIHFTSTDPDAVLPDDYTFVAEDGGQQTFTVQLQTAGTQTITAYDVTNVHRTGNVSVDVTADFEPVGFAAFFGDLFVGDSKTGRHTR